jgi:hypothetical protein
LFTSKAIIPDAIDSTSIRARLARAGFTGTVIGSRSVLNRELILSRAGMTYAKHDEEPKILMA